MTGAASAGIASAGLSALSVGLPAHAGPSDVPPPLTAVRLLTEWAPEAVPLVAIVVVAGVYLYGVQVLRRRGDPWSPWRTVSFVGLGMGSAVLATSSALAAYDTVLLSVHMVQHMVLAMLVPIFTALGAPVTLALRTLPARPRSVLLSVIHSAPARVLTHPLVAAVLYVVNPFVLYFSGLYEATLRNPWLHDINHLHFVLVGSLWFWSVLGLDPLPSRPSHPVRLLAVFVTLPFHAFLGVAIMSMSSLIAGNWYAGLDRAWGPSPLEDQRLAGGLLWSSGDVIGIVVFCALFVQWASASQREAEREDRRLDRLEAARAAGTPGQVR
ncbi:MAG: cytochrome c oxidase assembly protein [Actinomycetota bacterium]|nr:cytochrome c oxidase assembly protein [Actinomycetota bacterium]